ncbi:hypothetical protein CMEL01_01475 [Colletotrichum melonis]|uniref:Uncharacterized protein n=1 Tax=Colletotrichum melonis TaxID=1209925 RepID=A0AAI9Y373_9PEZI|nr:hypothetical protein CMEL01_01475 [Colletotrichum melonis]
MRILLILLPPRQIPSRIPPQRLREETRIHMRGIEVIHNIRIIRHNLTTPTDSNIFPAPVIPEPAPRNRMPNRLLQPQINHRKLGLPRLHIEPPQNLLGALLLGQPMPRNNTVHLLLHLLIPRLLRRHETQQVRGVDPAVNQPRKQRADNKRNHLDRAVPVLHQILQRVAPGNPAILPLLDNLLQNHVHLRAAVHPPQVPHRRHPRKHDLRRRARAVDPLEYPQHALQQALVFGDLVAADHAHRELEHEAVHVLERIADALRLRPGDAVRDGRGLADAGGEFVHRVARVFDQQREAGVEEFLAEELDEVTVELGAEAVFLGLGTVFGNVDARGRVEEGAVSAMTVLVEVIANPTQPTSHSRSPMTPNDSDARRQM